MNWYTRIASGIIFPLHEKLKRHDSVRIRKQLEDSQWWSKESLEELQLTRLRKLLKSVYEHVPYYHQVMRSIDFDPEEISSLNDMKKLPFLTKEIIRKESKTLTADNAQNLSRFNTGGSTGSPLVFFIGNERVSHDVAAKWRATRWWDVDIGDPEIVLWGSPIELGSQDRLRAIRDKLLRTRLLPAFEMSDKNIDNFIDEIRRLRPAMLFGYPSAIAHIAKRAKSLGISMSNLGIKVAFVTAERLYDDQKALISEIFNCPVANGYGSRDAGFIAHQCPNGNMHITAEDVIVEIIDENGNQVPEGEPGEIVVTHLSTKDFPFIRYKTGDVAAMESSKCDCGRNLPVLTDIQGRATDFITASDGTVMHGLALIYIVRDLEGIENFKIIQQSKLELDVEIVVDETFQKQSIEIIKNGMQERLGRDVLVNVYKVDRIKPEKSGKYRYVMSKVET